MELLRWAGKIELGWVISGMACILVVEDEVLIRFTLAVWLRAEDHSVVEAVSADEAAFVLASPLVEVDAVISDVQMPGSMNGLELARRIRKKSPALPVILVSGHMLEGEAREAGAALFLRKPYDLGRLSQHITELVPQREQPQVHRQHETDSAR
jgi:DNA-binding NtrC family response regulator